jgi:dTDP-4-dehydrorhamnose 3,5-epimerase
MSRFVEESTSLSDLTCLTREVLGDSRGFFSRLFCEKELAPFLNGRNVKQINFTFTAERGVVRGMHFQYPPHAEMKLVSCLRGEIWDVAVDLRFDSPTFLQWHAETLSAANGKCLLIPEGFAHGFQTLSSEVELHYCHTASYSPDYEGALHPEDERLAIAWPVPITSMSDRDHGHARLDKTFTGIKL